MDTVKINIMIQARMSSRRFPGKILAPLNGQPILKHIIDRTKQVKNANQVIVVTSDETSDDPVMAYVKSLNAFCFRGSLNNVFNRFYCALKIFPCNYFVRLSADSPFIDPSLIEYLINFAKKNHYDVITNVLERTFPKGQSVEIIKSAIFSSIDQSVLTEAEKEHVFPYFYHHQNHFKIYSVRNIKNENHLNFCVDTIDDLNRLHQTSLDYHFCRDTTTCLIE